LPPIGRISSPMEVAPVDWVLLLSATVLIGVSPQVKIDKPNVLE
jgi:hypothetical protein